MNGQGRVFDSGAEQGQSVQETGRTRSKTGKKTSLLNLGYIVNSLTMTD